MARRQDPLLQQAQLESQVKYGSAKAGLAQLMVQALDDLQRGVAVQQSAAEGVKQAVRAAQPVVTQVYRQGDQSVRQAEQDMRHDLATLSAAADPYRAISDREAQSAKARLAIGLSSALKDLSSREVQAEEGRQYGVQKALSSYQDTASKTAAQSQALRAEEGAFTQATYGKLTAEQRKREEDRAQKELDRQQRADLENVRQSGADRRAQLPYDSATAGQLLSHQDRQAALKAKGQKPLLTQAQNNAALNKIRDAWVWADRLRKGGASEGTIRQVLATGHTSKLKDKRGVTQTSTVPKFDSLAANAATDMVFYGGIHPNDSAALESNGVRFTGAYSSWKRNYRAPDPNAGLKRVAAGIKRAGSIL